MPVTQGRVVVFNRRLPPALPGIIIEIDGHLYIDIDSAARDEESLRNEEPSWRDDLLLLRWFWQYDQYSAKRYFLPSHQTILVEWVISHGVNLNLGIKAAWEATADTAFKPEKEEKAIFMVHYGTHAVLEQAYLMSNYPGDVKTATAQDIKEYYVHAEDILNKKLATLEVYEIDLTEAPLPYRLQYKLYGLYKKLSKLFRLPGLFFTRS